MRVSRTIFRFLSVLAVCGLIAAPIARPAMALPAMPEVAASTAASAHADGMADHMPCCPKKAPAGCRDCPLMLLCQAGALAGLTGGASLPVALRAARVPPMLDEADLSGQGQGPPHRPPKA